MLYLDAFVVCSLRAKWILPCILCGVCLHAILYAQFKEIYKIYITLIKYTNAVIDSSSFY